ncbi:hypothetical protein HPP92_003892 [Vanilla planifolia]|uniref:ATP phosphoribosyltransferase n=1 Tax=Vanilla planifolia TaxID=51239 RepID=A0A835S3B2_VANPL|nr:hypothetical protein HPP92_003892 [Vanilla planifolia]
MRRSFGGGVLRMEKQEFCHEGDLDYTKAYANQTLVPSISITSLYLVITSDYKKRSIVIRLSLMNLSLNSHYTELSCACVDVDEKMTSTDLGGCFSVEIVLVGATGQNPGFRVKSSVFSVNAMMVSCDFPTFFHFKHSPMYTCLQQRPDYSGFLCRAAAPNTIAPAAPTAYAEAEARKQERTAVRLGLPSKGRMADETLTLLKNCQLGVRQVNPRQYVADIPQLSNMEVWFQRPKDIVRKLQSGDLDLGIVGLDTVCEYGQGNEDLVLVHDELEYGDCRLSIADYSFQLGTKFTEDKGLKHVSFSTADGALEAAPAMGISDAIMDLVGSGTTLRENNLKEIEDGVVLESQAVLVGSKKSLTQRDGVLDITHEILERLEAHLRASGQYTVTANMKGSNADEVAERILGQASLSGLQGPTISPVYTNSNGKVKVDYYAIVICVPRKALYDSVKQLRLIGGSGVLVSPLTYIFEEETPKWKTLLKKLGM